MKVTNASKILLAAVVISTAVFMLAAPSALVQASSPGGTARSGDSAGRSGDGAGRSGDSATRPAANPSEYLSNLYLWFLGFVGIAALFAFVVGGIMWMFSSSLTSTAEARKWITNAIWGIVLAAASYLILNTINPDLVAGFDLKTVIQRAMPQRVP